MARERSTAAAIAAVLTLVASPGLSAQYLGGGTKTAAEVRIADLEQLRDKFVGLAGAFPEATYDWRPMEGVRSVRDVLMLIAVEGTILPTMWDLEAPEWVAAVDLGAEYGRLRELSKEELIGEIERSFEHLLGRVGALSAEEFAASANFFGLTTDLGTALDLLANDMHEHLGQAIAYARMNEVVPPWSRPG